MNNWKIIAAYSLCCMSGCTLPTLPDFGSLAPTKYHDVSYYDTHPIERSQTNSWCGNNPGLAVRMPSCDSADTSGIHAWHRKMGWE